MNLLKHYNDIYELKIIVFGESCVGKSSLITRFVDDVFEKFSRGTIFVNFSTKLVQLHDKLISLQIWDSADHDAYNKFLPVFYKEAGAAIVVYDVINLHSFDRAKYWINEIKNKCGQQFPISLVCNKIDLNHDENIVNMGTKYAQDNGLLFVKISAKNNVNVNRVFEEIVGKIQVPINEIDNRFISKSQRIIQLFDRGNIPTIH